MDLILVVLNDLVIISIDRIADELNKGEGSRIVLVAPKKAGVADGLYENKLQMVATGNQLNEQVNTLTDSELHTMIQVAKNYWLEAGAANDKLENINFSIADLAQNSSIETQAITITQGNNIIIDSTVKGYGWYVDATVSTNEEYQVDNTGYRYTALTDADSANSIDLLTGLSTGLNTSVLNNTSQPVISNDTPQHACFAAGVLVHTDKGLIPIEQLKVGDMVLSAPEDAKPSLADGKLETVYKPITKVFKSAEKQALMAPLGHPAVICTTNHPFWSLERGWVRADEVDNATNIYRLFPPLWSKGEGDQLSPAIFMKEKGHWVYGGDMETYSKLYQLTSPQKLRIEHYYRNSFRIGDEYKYAPHLASYYSEGKMRYLLQTPFEGIAVGFYSDDDIGPHNLYSDRRDNGPYIQDFNNGKYTASQHYGDFDGEVTEEESIMYDAAIYYVLEDMNYDFYKDTVYNIEVADYHTYFVSDSGIWVHNCDPSTINNEFATLNDPEQWQ